MSALEHLAARAAADPQFLGWALADYARTEELDDAGLAAAFGLAADQLPLLKLCRMPRAARFAADVAAVAKRFGLDATLLAVAVRRAQGIARVRPDQPTGAAPGFLLAARDDDRPPPAEGAP